MLIDPDLPPAPETLGTARPAHILVVEDDFVVRMMLVEVLADAGYQVAEAGTADEAVALLQAEVDLLVTDIQMPGSLDGRALAALARQTRPNLAVIYTSGQTQDGTALAAREIAVPKPYQGSDIRAAVARMLAL